MSKRLAKVVVGSRLHDTATPESDWDYRGIYTDDLKDLGLKELEEKCKRKLRIIEGCLKEIDKEMTTRKIYKKKTQRIKSLDKT